METYHYQVAWRRAADMQQQILELELQLILLLHVVTLQLGVVASKSLFGHERCYIWIALPALNKAMQYESRNVCWSVNPVFSHT